MARIRTIKPGFFLNEDVASLPFHWRLLFVGLWTQADRAGRLEDRPARLKASLFPYDDLDIEAGLSALALAGFITRYERDGRRLLSIPTWAKHQQPHVKEAPSEIPEPEHGANTVLAPVEPVGSRKGREQEGNGVDSPEPPHAAASGLAAATRAGLDLRADDDDSPILLLFPIVGLRGPEWRLRRRQVEEWQQVYPNLDVMDECRRALSWIRANPGRRKTHKGMAQFLNGWLGRTVDRRGGSERAPASTPAPMPRQEDFEEECQRLHGGSCDHDPVEHRRKKLRESLGMPCENRSSTPCGKPSIGF